MDIKEVDKIILQNVKSLGWEPDVEIINLQELDVSDLAKMMIKCLFAIDGECDLPHVLPQNMAQRFRCAAKIAEIIKNLGYHGDLGYQTILYPNEVDLRKMFMFLIEKIPKDSPTLGKEAQGRSVAVEMEAKKKISNLLKRPWVPSHCIAVARKYKYPKSDFPPLTEYGIQHCHLFSSVPSDITKGVFLKQAVNENKLFPSLLNIHAEQLGQEISMSEFDKDCYIERGIAKTKLNQRKGLLQRNYSLQPAVPERKSFLYKISEAKHFNDEHETELLKTDTKEKDKRVVELQEREKELHIKMQETEVRLLETEEKIQLLQTGLIEEKKNIESEEKKISSLLKTVSLLPDMETNVEKLKNGLATCKDKEGKLLKKWLDYKTPLQTEFEDLKFQVNNKKNKKKELLEEISDLKQQMRSLAVESTKKEALLMQLRQQHECLPKGVNRSVYTKQILDISSKVRKEKQEIDKVLRDTRLIQKEINNLTGKLDRTFAVAEDESFKAATSNEKSRPIYRAVISIHEEFGQLVELIRETGSIQREIADLAEQVNSEKAKTVEVNLKKVQEDLNKIKLENSVMKKRLNLNNSEDP